MSPFNWWYLGSTLLGLLILAAMTFAPTISALLPRWRPRLRRIEQGNVHPSPWWGYCWSEDYDNVHVLAPIGLNVVIVFARWLWQWVCWRLTRRLFPDGARTLVSDAAAIAQLERLKAKLPIDISTDDQLVIAARECEARLAVSYAIAVIKQTGAR